MSETVRIGICSFAHMHAHSYANSMMELDGVELIGIYDEDPKRGQEQAAFFASQFFSTLDELLNAGLDGLIICSENANHRAHVEAAAGHVGTILCEKPIATSIEDGEAIIACCNANAVRLQIAFPVRFSPPIQELKRSIEQNVLGEILAVKCTNHGTMPGRWFVNPELSGGGAVIDHTVHIIDVLRWIWQAEVDEVYAEIGENLLHPDLGIDDAGMLSFRLSNGIFGTLDTSWSRPSSYPTWGDGKIEVLGDRGVIRVDAFRQFISVSSDQWGKTNWVPWGSDMDLGLIRDFVQMIREDRAPSITGEDGLRALEVALAAYRSAREGEPVTLRNRS